jgi:hypothetical protein
MSDYTKLVKEEAKRFYEAAAKEFAEDSGEFGGKSNAPNLGKWIDAGGKLSARVAEIAAKWTHKDHLWVEGNTRNRPKHGGGDRASNAYVAFLQDVRHEVKKLAKKGN